jgi:hypothetical protein
MWVGAEAHRYKLKADRPDIKPRSGALSLGRPFKAVNMDAMNSASRERRLNSIVAAATERLLSVLSRALKDPAKFTRPLRGLR